MSKLEEEIGKLIKEPIGYLVPKEIEDKVGLVVVESSEKGYKGLEFKGITSEIHYIDFELILKKDLIAMADIRKIITDDIDKKEIELVQAMLKKHPNKKALLVRRKINQEISKLMGIGKANYRVIIANPLIKKIDDGIDGLYVGIYGYESVIITTK